MRPFDDRRVLLVVTGGIAAYKSAFLTRRLQDAGAEVEVVLTRSARRFVGAATFQGLTGRDVHTDLWERPMAHLELGRRADLVVVAPATADLLARMAAGRADDLAAAALLASDAPVLACPAMNTRMWKNPATRRNVARLREDGVVLVGPDRGRLAEDEVGIGRMSDPSRIVAEAGRALEDAPAFRDRKVVVTAGPTRAALDPVRFLSNRSTGRMGFALAASAWRRGAETVLVSGPARAPAPPGPRLVEVEAAEEMLDVLREELDRADVLLMAAAVADFRPVRVREEKIRKDEGPLEVSLDRGPDLLRETREERSRDGVLTVGFALETGGGRQRARAKLEEKGMDFVALNRPEVGLGTPDNEVTLIDRWGGEEDVPRLPKEAVADRILDRVAERVGG